MHPSLARKQKKEYPPCQVDDQGLYQLFMLDPNGVKIELNYSNSEAEGLRAEVKASELPG